jgi:DNA-binding transcriptional MerR regulator
MYTIAQMAAQLGVSVPTIRSWERRYGLVIPTRTTGGHRRYTDDDLDRLRVFAEVARRQATRETADLLHEIDARPQGRVEQH